MADLRVVIGCQTDFIKVHILYLKIFLSIWCSDSGYGGLDINLSKIMKYCRLLSLSKTKWKRRKALFDCQHANTETNIKFSRYEIKKKKKLFKRHWESKQFVRYYFLWVGFLQLSRHAMTSLKTI